MGLILLVNVEIHSSQHHLLEEVIFFLLYVLILVRYKVVTATWIILGPLFYLLLYVCFCASAYCFVTVAL